MVGAYENNFGLGVVSYTIGLGLDANYAINDQVFLDSSDNPDMVNGWSTNMVAGYAVLNAEESIVTIGPTIGYSRVTMRYDNSLVSMNLIGQNLDLGFAAIGVVEIAANWALYIGGDVRSPAYSSISMEIDQSDLSLSGSFEAVSAGGVLGVAYELNRN
jgi:hypothetical protein